MSPLRNDQPEHSVLFTDSDPGVLMTRNKCLSQSPYQCHWDKANKTLGHVLCSKFHHIIRISSGPLPPGEAPWFGQDSLTTGWLNNAHWPCLIKMRWLNLQIIKMQQIPNPVVRELTNQLDPDLFNFQFSKDIGLDSLCLGAHKKDPSLKAKKLYSLHLSGQCLCK